MLSPIFKPLQLIEIDECAKRVNTLVEKAKNAAGISADTPLTSLVMDYYCIQSCKLTSGTTSTSA